MTSVNVSNVYGDCGPEGGPQTPLLGIFATALECQEACEKNPNCTQYGWASAAQQAEEPSRTYQTATLNALPRRVVMGIGSRPLAQCPAVA